MADDNKQARDRGDQKTADTMRPHSMQGDTAQKNEQSARRGRENTQNTLRPRDQQTHHEK